MVSFLLAGIGGFLFADEVNKNETNESQQEITKTEYEKNKNAIGVYVLGASQPIGGIQYERRFNDLLSAKFNSYINYNKHNESNPLDYNLIGEVDFTVFEEAWNEKHWKNNVTSRLYIYLLGGHKGTLSGDYYYDEDSGSYIDEPAKYHAATVLSAGFGFDFVLFDHLSMPVQFGYIGQFPYETEAGFCVGTGVRYSW